MVKLDETPLPGVGMRYDFDSRSGKRVGVITHRDGRREIFVARRDDPDACAESIVLADDEAEAVADLLGGSSVTRRLETSMQDIQGLAMDWLPLPDTSPFVGELLGSTMMRTRTGTSIVAVMRGQQAVPAPGPELTFERGDVVVVVGTAPGIRQAAALLRGTP
ncbi:cation:proton antiporter regulatory subunit [Deinococcus sp. 14RED07]|uniref:cation:proton antiporter regulatory subunit n=1 Tax=Deinococcus sp. 14RED07 TaxID=2745874 RepID=UPI001E40362F|nr:cation:proton antiporter regulatory subunit [Deinococcus sp. 14RED07]MCD0177380.1 cation:proton antiporter regulatory subunit [Deinococcus sp. 14RED07]